MRTKQHNFTLDGLVGIDLFGKTVGIIGTGGIGMCAINIFLGFGCKVLAYDIFPNEQAAKEKGFSYVTKDELLEQSDIGMLKYICFLLKNEFSFSIRLCTVV